MDLKTEANKTHVEMRLDTCLKFVNPYTFNSERVKRSTCLCLKYFGSVVVLLCLPT